ncbi:MAG: alkaline phosphatase [Acidobacteriota bacterium]
MCKYIIYRILSALLLFSLVSTTIAQETPVHFPVKRDESSEFWRRDGQTALDRAKNTKIRKGKAKNIILFLGDGMGISTVTAARILEGQLRGESGEENRLAFENFPFTAFSRTYSTNQQTSDSAPTMSAIVTGVKTNEGIISLNNKAIRGDYKSAGGNEEKSILAYAEEAGKSTGLVTTARITHATPAACYAHSPDRDWESDADIFARSKEAYNAGFPDIARQLIDFPYGDGIDVIMGGGRSKFLKRDQADPEYPERRGERLDNRDLTAEWQKKHPNGKFVWNKDQFTAAQSSDTRKLFGLFEPSHLKFEFDRKGDKSGEPSLSEMTAKAIDILSRNKKGFFLMVEGGRIDMAHHDGNAFRALTETIEFSNAVKTALSKVNLDETLIIVTADHSHTFTIGGYPARGNNILGLIREAGPGLVPDRDPKLDLQKKPMTTLGYANGPGYRNGTRPILTDKEVTDPNFKQEAAVPLTSETHAGEDVPIFADGVNAYLIRGSMEESWLFYVMADAFGFHIK